MTGADILPDFLIIGAMKAGTTTLYDYLSRHPQVGMSREKETDFFIAEGNWARGLGWYQAQFTPGRQVYGEASPNYAKWQAFAGVPDRVHTLLPGVRLVYIIRDPVARAASQYRHAVLTGVRVPAPEALIGSHHLQHLVDCSSYAAQIEPWMALFPPQQMLILRFEDLTRDPAQVLSALAGFLDIADTWPQTDAIVANSADSLARLPPWLFWLRNTAAAGWIKAVISARMRARLKGLVQRRTPRPAPDLPPDARAHIRQAVAGDWARLCSILPGSARR